jgi:hypothetical protein
MKWTVGKNAMLQAVACTIQVLNVLVAGPIPEEWRGPIAIALTVAQAVGAGLAHFNNPDGTPADQPWKQ